MKKERNRVRIVIIVIMGVGILLCLSTFTYLHVPLLRGSHEVTKQVDKLIENKDSDQIKKIAVDKKTYRFLMNLSPSVTAQNTSDAQGTSQNGQSLASYYVTVIKNKKINVWVTTSTKFHLIPKWKLKSIGLQ